MSQLPVGKICKIGNKNTESVQLIISAWIESGKNVGYVHVAFNQPGNLDCGVEEMIMLASNGLLDEVGDSVFELPGLETCEIQIESFITRKDEAGGNELIPRDHVDSG